MAIKCHSGFVHYNMFHNSCHGGGNNYGSIFNITNNCSGGHTSFWGGLGAGLGFGFGGMLGGLFSNFLGGFGNMFGGFGMGNMFGLGGFGGFGGWGNGLSGLWGGGSDRGGSVDRDYSEYSSRRSRRSSRKEDDKDYSEILKLQDEANDLIIAAKSPENDDKINGKTPDEMTADDIAGITEDDASKLSEDDKNKLINKIGCLPPEGREKLAKAGTSELVRTAAKKTFYNGYTNYDGSAELKGSDINRAHDNSGKTRDTVKVNGKDATVEKAENGNHPATIVIHDRKDITYTYVKQKDGEYIYISNQDQQLYALQKSTSGQYDLIQYQWHTGYGKKDWSVQ